MDKKENVFFKNILKSNEKLNEIVQKISEQEGESVKHVARTIYDRIHEFCEAERYENDKIFGYSLVMLLIQLDFTFGLDAILKEKQIENQVKECINSMCDEAMKKVLAYVVSDILEKCTQDNSH